MTKTVPDYACEPIQSAYSLLRPNGTEKEIWFGMLACQTALKIRLEEDRPGRFKEICTDWQTTKVEEAVDAANRATQ